MRVTSDSNPNGAHVQSASVCVRCKLVVPPAVEEVVAVGISSEGNVADGRYRRPHIREAARIAAAATDRAGGGSDRLVGRDGLVLRNSFFWNGYVRRVGRLKSSMGERPDS